MTETPLLEVEGLVPRELLSGAQRQEMFALLAQYFDGVTRDQFESDLASKNWVVEIRRDGRLLGFSTLLAREASFYGETFTAIYSGDTIVAPEAWGNPALARHWIAAVNYLRAGFAGRRCYWLLLTSGFRTYRFLPVFWREFFPRYSAATPPDTRRLLDHLAHTQYGGSYDAEAGIVRFAHPQRLRGALREVPAGRGGNPHVSFFLACNPGHGRGDELACITEISDANLTGAGRRMVTGEKLKDEGGRMKWTSRT
jgi:hypothetical protein